MTPGRNRDELGIALRQWRARLTPADVGLPSGTRRRTPGLRREEVSRLAGMSVDYLSRLEQARGPQPSSAVLTALARALRLSDDERDHLFVLAGAAPPRPGAVRDAVRPSVLRLMDRFTDLPALLVNARGDVLAWNEMAAALVGDLSAVPAARRNLVRLHFLGDAQRLVADAEELARLDQAAVADLRAAAARYPDDARLRELLAELRAASPRFEAVWRQRPVDARHSDRKRFAHPQVGELELDCDTLLVPGDDQVLVVFSAAPESPDAAALALLRVVGSQHLTPAPPR